MAEWAYIGYDIGVSHAFEKKMQRFEAESSYFFTYWSDFKLSPWVTWNDYSYHAWAGHQNSISRSPKINYGHFKDVLCDKNQDKYTYLWGETEKSCIILNTVGWRVKGNKPNSIATSSS